MHRIRFSRGIFLLFLMVALVGLNGWSAHAGPGGGTWFANTQAGGVTGTALTKFVDKLPGLGLPGCNPAFPTGGGFSCNANNLGQYIPIANADTLTFPGSDYYELGLKDHLEQMHTNLPGTGYGTGTRIRSYYQINSGNALGVTTDHSQHYLGPLIIAAKDRPVRIKFVNELCRSDNVGCPAGQQPNGNLFIPVDTTMMGAGTGPLGGAELYTQNRATVHLHGGHSPWISDGTPHQWITPAGDPTNYKKGASFQNVPDMVGPGKLIPAPSLGDGIGTYYWTNQQSSRLMFYHDHAYGITRLNVYAGEAAGYLITDAAEEALITARDIPNICPGSETTPGTLCEYKYGIPLVVQDKSFVPANVATQDTLWDTVNWGGQGQLWFPHVYEPAQSLTTPDGLNPLGRWDYGPWVWPPSPVTNPILPALSTVPEAFMDTPIVNGTAYPYLDVQPKAYRFRILSAGNDRTFNLQLYYGATAAGVVCNNNTTPAAQCTEVNMVPAIPRDLCTGIITTNCVCNPGGGATPAGCFPPTWPADGRDGGVPDPATAGPQMIQIGTESGFLPAPVTLANHPITYDDVGNIADKTLVLMAAERADVLIDFTGVPQGSTVILYNDAPSAFPGGDPRYDYYTGNPDATLSGGAPSTLAGFGPNTRTIMQFRVTNAAAAAPVTTVNTGTLPAALAAAYAAGQPAHIVPDGTYAKLLDTSMTVGGKVIPFMGKSINEGFDSAYGRINAMLGTEDPSGLNPSNPLEYIAPATEIVGNDQVQLWKIVHNGVDSHPIHFHLMDVQVVNRMGWDGSIKPPDPSEAGWKETVRMNPMEDIIVALRPTLPQLPFTLPNSIRPLDTTQPVSVTNPDTNFGHEYVWHCHILGHEEFDLMRPIVLNVDQLLYADFAGTGIQKWDMGTWSQLNTIDPTSMVASGSLLYAKGMPGYPGVWQWDGTAWNNINSVTPANMVVSGSTLYVSGMVGNAGIWKWNGTAWTQLGGTDPASMVVSGSNLYVSFTGQGIWSWNGTAWTQLGGTDPASMVVAGSNLYASFTGQGVWFWNGTAWIQLGGTDPASMLASGSFLYASYTGQGIWSWNGTAWTQLGGTDPASMVASGSNLYASFTGQGIWSWNGTAWTQLGGTDPASMIASGAVLYASFAGQGLYKWEAGAWTQLTPTIPAIIAAGF